MQDCINVPSGVIITVTVPLSFVWYVAFSTNFVAKRGYLPKKGWSEKSNFPYQS